MGVVGNGLSIALVLAGISLDRFYAQPAGRAAGLFAAVVVLTLMIRWLVGKQQCVACGHRWFPVGARVVELGWFLAVIVLLNGLYLGAVVLSPALANRRLATRVKDIARLPQDATDDAIGALLREAIRGEGLEEHVSLRDVRMLTSAQGRTIELRYERKLDIAPPVWTPRREFHITVHEPFAR
ncbi:MAG: hypothetical protein JXP73_01710 [Deltaproteobacteria bacterium]|nr:hypothetical protein [Deltaproteobacteria bacterium]